MISTLAPTAAQDALALKQVWETIGPNSCPYSYNFHLHTNCSDGRLTPEALIKQVIDIGLKGLAITDHHSVRGFQAAYRCLESWTQSSQLLPQLWTGVEVTSKLEGVEVHILGFAFNPNHPAVQPYLQGDRPLGDEARAANVIEALHQAGGLVVLAHPSRYSLPATKLIPAAAELGIDGVEAYYAYGNPKPWKPSFPQTDIAKQLASEYGLLTTCGTDTHGLNLLQRI